MNTTGQSTTELLIRAEVGSTASIALVSGTNVTPMSVVMSCARQHLPKEFEVWWVDEGPPSMFALSSPRTQAVVFSTRALEIAAQTRQLYEESLSSSSRRASYRLTLLHLSELLLQQRSGSLATAAFLESIRGQTLFLPFGTDWRLLEYEPINEAYMALWFFSLGHELGHMSVEASPTLSSSLREALDNQIRALATEQIEAGLNLPDSVKERLRQGLDDPSTELPLYAPSLMEECAADVFSCQVLLESTLRVFQRMEKKVSLWKLAYELLAANSVRSHFDSIKGMARTLASTEHWEESADRYFGYSLAASTRTHYLSSYLSLALSQMVESDSVPKLVDDLTRSVHESACEVSAGSVDAFSHLLTIEPQIDSNRLPAWLCEQFNRSPIGIEGPARRFCELASSFSVENSQIQELRQLIACGAR
jgi:hypothetical protein